MRSFFYEFSIVRCTFHRIITIRKVYKKTVVISIVSRADRILIESCQHIILVRNPTPQVHRNCVMITKLMMIMMMILLNRDKNN